MSIINASTTKLLSVIKRNTVLYSKINVDTDIVYNIMFLNYSQARITVLVSTDQKKYSAKSRQHAWGLKLCQDSSVNNSTDSRYFVSVNPTIRKSLSEFTSTYNHKHLSNSFSNNYIMGGGRHRPFFFTWQSCYCSQYWSRLLIAINRQSR